MDRTNFKPKKRKAEAINKLIADLSEKTGIEGKVLEKQSKRAIKNWEKATRVKTVNLFASEPHHISAIIPHIVTYFETEFKPVIHETSEMNEILEMTSNALKDMYGID